MEKKNRCTWVDKGQADYIQYHDEEWGLPICDDKKHFELLTLEGAQAGLSWLTVLRKRSGYRQSFAAFSVEEVAAFSKARCEQLCEDVSIVRNRLKVYATVNNAQRFLEIQASFGSFNQYIWGFVAGQPIVNNWKCSQVVPAHTPLSDQISKDLQQRGFKFVGTKIIYAYLQAAGLVNDHTVDCFRHQELGGHNSIRC